MAGETSYQVCILGRYLSGVGTDLEEDVMGTCWEASPIIWKNEFLPFLFFLP